MQLDIFKMEARKEVETANKAAFDQLQLKMDQMQDERDDVKREYQLLKTAHENMKLDHEKQSQNARNKYKEELDMVMHENENLQS